jgi:predicted TIM-barrel fold metal-dependent hydrolase
VGSASRLVTTASDAPADMVLCLTYVNSLLALSDYLYSGIFEVFTDLKIVLAESQAGWIPFAAERVDNTWKKGNEKFTASNARSGRRATELPSSKVAGHIYGAIFDDYVGLKNRDQIGLENILFETDIPHADSTYPKSLKVLEEMTMMAGMNENEVYQFVRGNAIKLYGLDRYFGITH